MIERKNSGRKSKRPNSNELEKMYKTFTAREIAEEYDVTECTVRNWLADYRKRNGQSRYKAEKGV